MAVNFSKFDERAGISRMKKKVPFEKEGEPFFQPTTSNQFFETDNVFHWTRSQINRGRIDQIRDMPEVFRPVNPNARRVIQFVKF